MASLSLLLGAFAGSPSHTKPFLISSSPDLQFKDTSQTQAWDCLLIPGKTAFYPLDHPSGLLGIPETVQRWMLKWHFRQGEQSLSFTGKEKNIKIAEKNYKGCRRFSTWGKMYNQITWKAKMKLVLRNKQNQGLQHHCSSFFIVFARHFVVSRSSFSLPFNF